MLFGHNGTVRARRCTICSINYPPFIEVCRICEGETWPMYKSGPDPDWESRVGASLGEGLYLDPPIAYAPRHPANADLPMHSIGGRLWVGHSDLLSVGYRNLEPDAVVFVGGAFYELQGYSQSRNAWWVEEIVTDGAASNLTPEMFNG